MTTGQTNCNSCGQPLNDAELGADGYGPRDIRLCAKCRRLSAAQHRHGWQPIMQWEDGWEGLRLASCAPVPWDNRNIAMLHITHDGKISVSHTLTGKRRMLQDAAHDDMVLIAWPGGRRQDMFIVDNRKAALRALG
jgi:hypothetical protein